MLLISKKKLRTEELKDTFVNLIKEHERLIFKVCHMYADNEADKQDLFQEILIQLWQGYPRFRGDAKFSTWLFQVAINTALSNLKKVKRAVKYENIDAVVPSISDTDYREEQERSEQLYNAIAHLNEIEKAIVMLYLENKTYEEMEDILGISSGALRVKMHRIKEKLRQLTKDN